MGSSTIIKHTPEGLANLQSQAEAKSVADVPVHTFMSKNLLSIPEGTKIYSAIYMMAAHKVGCAPVVNKQQKIVGVISEHDLLLQTAVRDVVSSIEFVKPAITVDLNSTLREALVLLYKHKFRRIPVVESRGFIAGSVTRMDILCKLIGKEPT